MLPLIGLLFGFGVGVLMPTRDGRGADELVSSRSTGDQRTKSGDQVSSEHVELSTEAMNRLSKGGLDQAFIDSLEDKSQFEQLGLLYARIRDAQLDDYPSLFEALDKQTSSTRWMMQSILMTRWVDENPQAVLAYIESQPEDQQWRLRNSFYGTWAKADPDAAFSAAMGIANPRFRSYAINSIVNSITHDEPRRAVEMALEVNDGTHQSDWMFESIFRTWGRQDVTAARQAAMNLPEGKIRTRALTGAMQHWMQEDPESALDWLNAQEASSTIFTVRQRAFQRFMDHQPEEAKRFIEAETDPFQRREMVNGIHFGNHNWKRDFSETEAVFDWLGTVVTGDTYDRKVGDVVRAMTDMDSAMAMEFAMQLRPGNARMNALGSVASRLAERDPVAAVDFLNQMEYRDERERVISNMSWNLARNHPETARRLVEESGDELIQQRMVNPLVQEWVKYDRGAALLWVEGLVDDSARQNGYSTVLGSWIQSDPQSALSYIGQGLEGGAQYYRNAFSTWSRQDPEMAIAWLDELPEDMAGRDGVYRAVADSYVRHDPMAASEWITTLEDGPERDSAVQSLVYQVKRADPEAAFIWSSTITDDGQRANMLRNSISDWKRDDPEAALAAVEASDIDAEEKRPLLEMFD
ncbi:hypothetical protein [Coraliomargarita akajimensis]|nr:hypothetical protein [Coraliomargarita akajimensis]